MKAKDKLHNLRAQLGAHDDAIAARLAAMEAEFLDNSPSIPFEIMVVDDVTIAWRRHQGAWRLVAMLHEPTVLLRASRLLRLHVFAALTEDIFYTAACAALERAIVERTEVLT